MSLLLTLEHGPRSQAVQQTRLERGDLVIGRSPEADWQIDDPDMYVSRAHCTISARSDGFFVTDTSTSGLFIDDAGNPLGTGNSARLQSGMRLRLGDYVVAVDVLAPPVEKAAEPFPQAAVVPEPAPSRTPVSLGHDDFFSAKTEEEPVRPKPSGLPDPFEQVKSGSFDNFRPRDADQRSSQAFDDPFSLDPLSSNAAAGNGHSRDPFDFDAAFSNDTPARDTAPEPGQDVQPGWSEFGTPDPVETADPAPLAPVPAPAVQPVEAKASGRAPWELPVEESADEPPFEVAPATPPAPQPEPAAPAKFTPPPAQPARRGKPAAPATVADADADLRAAFLRGLRLEEDDFPGHDPVAEMEKFGREYRLMMEGLMQLLRKRAEEKVNARVAQTIVGASEVNPLKFLPTVDDALATMLAERSPGFLAGEPAIRDAVRDLAHHHVRAWRGVQAALRRMIDRFDPTSLEEELKSGSAIGTLLSGGRGAKLWELYQKRHREIAQSAENRFLGEVGADFRDAYEEE